MIYLKTSIHIEMGRKNRRRGVSQGGEGGLEIKLPF